MYNMQKMSHNVPIHLTKIPSVAAGETTQHESACDCY